MIRDITSPINFHSNTTSISSFFFLCHHFYSASFRHDLVYKSHFSPYPKNYSVLFLNYLVITHQKSQKDLPSDFLYLDEWTETRINLLFLASKTNPSNPAIAPARTAAVELPVPVFGSRCLWLQVVQAVWTSGVGSDFETLELVGGGGTDMLVGLKWRTKNERTKVSTLVTVGA